MNTRFAERFLHFLFISAFVLGIVWVPDSIASAQEPMPNPHLQVNPNQDRVDAYDWALGAVVTLTIHRPGTPQSADYTSSQTIGPDPWTPDIVSAGFDLNGVYQVQAGDLVTMSDGTTAKTHTVANVIVTGIDLTADTISGLADPGTQIETTVWGHHTRRDVIANSNGQWIADYSAPWKDQVAYDLVPGLSGIAMYYDSDGDSTGYVWDVPIPYLVARLTLNRVEAYDWIVGHSLLLTIDDLTTSQVPDYTDTQVVTAVPDDPLSGIAAFQLDGFSLRAGQVIEITDGEQSQTLTVADVAVTTVDVVHDVISGTAGPGIAQVIVRIWSSPDNLPRLVDVVNGQWRVDFSVPGDQPNESQTWDIQPGDNGIVRVGDPSGNVTTNYWEAPIAVNQLTALSPARIWIGLKNSDDIGTKFDLLVEVYQNNALVGSGELDKVNGGSSGFNNAKLNSIPLTLFAPVSWPTGSTLSTKLYVRNTCYGNTHNSGTARFWYDDASANSQFAVTIASVVQSYFIRDGFALSLTPGTEPKKTIDVAAGKPCSAFKPFGTWSITP